jgi:DNA-3-methyladenine glycosylase I
VNAAIENARRIRAIQKEAGSFARWLDSHHPLSLDEWRRVFRKTFVFTGGEIVNSFLLSKGYLPGAHDKSCSIHATVLAARPPRTRA